LSVTVLIGDCIARMRELPALSADCCVTSPPYWGLRDYGVAGQLGLEETPEQYVAGMVAVFREVRRVLRDDGTLWLNLGDSYAANRSYQVHNTKGAAGHTYGEGSKVPDGLKPKDLVGIPWRVAFALQADGWYLRSDIIWSKPNPMPESVTDRPTKAHEYVFLLAKSERYFFDAEAISEAAIHAGRTLDYTGDQKSNGVTSGLQRTLPKGRKIVISERKNSRTVWTLGSQAFPGAHFATMPPALAERCIRAGSREGGTVLDPFGGAGTTALVAAKLGRNAVLTELNPDYAAMAARRVESAMGLLCPVTVDG